MIAKKWRLYFLFMTWMAIGVVLAQEMGGYPGRMADDEKGDIPQGVQNRLRTLLSGITETGVSPAGESVFYGRNLWEYIDGAAESFHAYRFVALIHQDYVIGDAEITVDIYDMSNPLLAFGMYASERSPEYSFLDVGAEGYGDELGLNFFQDRYYVKLTIFSESDSTLPLLEKVARKISENIGTGKNLPNLFSRFPDTNRIARSEQYFFQAPFGYSFLSPVFCVQYRNGEGTSILMVAVTQSQPEAVQQGRKLEDHFKESGRIERIPEMGEHAFRAMSSYQTETIVVPSGKVLFILKDPPDNGISFLKKAMDSILRK